MYKINICNFHLKNSGMLNTGRNMRQYKSLQFTAACNVNICSGIRSEAIDINM
jgi:hypothetical protein